MWTEAPNSVAIDESVKDVIHKNAPTDAQVETLFDRISTDGWAEVLVSVVQTDKGAPVVANAWDGDLTTMFALEDVDGVMVSDKRMFSRQVADILITILDQATYEDPEELAAQFIGLEKFRNVNAIERSILQLKDPRTTDAVGVRNVDIKPTYINALVEWIRAMATQRIGVAKGLALQLYTLMDIGVLNLRLELSKPTVPLKRIGAGILRTASASSTPMQSLGEYDLRNLVGRHRQVKSRGIAIHMAGAEDKPHTLPILVRNAKNSNGPIPPHYTGPPKTNLEYSGVTVPVFLYHFVTVTSPAKVDGAKRDIDADKIIVDALYRTLVAIGVVDGNTRVFAQGLSKVTRDMFDRFSSYPQTAARGESSYLPRYTWSRDVGEDGKRDSNVADDEQSEGDAISVGNGNEDEVEVQKRHEQLPSDASVFVRLPITNEYEVLSKLFGSQDEPYFGTPITDLIDGEGMEATVVTLVIAPSEVLRYIAALDRVVSPWVHPFGLEKDRYALKEALKRIAKVSLELVKYKDFIRNFINVDGTPVESLEVQLKEWAEEDEYNYESDDNKDQRHGWISDSDSEDEEDVKEDDITVNGQESNDSIQSEPGDQSASLDDIIDQTGEDYGNISFEEQEEGDWFGGNLTGEWYHGSDSDATIPVDQDILEDIDPIIELAGAIVTLRRLEKVATSDSSTEKEIQDSKTMIRTASDVISKLSNELELSPQNRSSRVDVSHSILPRMMDSDLLSPDVKDTVYKETVPAMVEKASLGFITIGFMLSNFKTAIDKTYKETVEEKIGTRVGETQDYLEILSSMQSRRDDPISSVGDFYPTQVERAVEHLQKFVENFTEITYIDGLALLKQAAFEVNLPAPEVSADLMDQSSILENSSSEFMDDSGVSMEDSGGYENEEQIPGPILAERRDSNIAALLDSDIESDSESESESDNESEYEKTDTEKEIEKINAIIESMDERFGEIRNQDRTFTEEQVFGNIEDIAKIEASIQNIVDDHKNSDTLSTLSRNLESLRETITAFKDILNATPRKTVEEIRAEYFTELKRGVGVWTTELTYDDLIALVPLDDEDFSEDESMQAESDTDSNFETTATAPKAVAV